MKRVKKGKCYLFIRVNGSRFNIDSIKDTRQSFDLENFKSGNYFTCVEDAHKVLKKVTKCFKGKPFMFDLGFHKHLFNKYLNK